MLYYMIKTNNLMPYFEQARLDENDLIFIKELIDGESNEQTNDQVRFKF